MSRRRKYYYTTVIPTVPGHPGQWHSTGGHYGHKTYGPSAWHPTERTGPFSVLTSGAHPTKWQAEEWARTHLGGAPSSTRRYRAYSKRAPKFVRTRRSR